MDEEKGECPSEKQKERIKNNEKRRHRSGMKGRVGKHVCVYSHVWTPCSCATWCLRTG
jgi:hypothetical protein